CSIDEFEEALICLTKGDYRIERWTRIGIQTRDRMLRATSEIFIGEYAREMMSRHILALSGGEREEQKCSGILVASGAGSTGWYDSAIRYLVPDGAPYSSQSTELRYLVTEPYRGKFSGLRFLNGEVSPGQPLELTILSDSQPVIALDSFKRFPLARGERLRIAPSRVPLNVLQVGE
ncbi:MAG: hypothetical protein KDD64_15880, partial [Bdellovibrionales bacterium]|nr:hypothetical protein [Bdellovibrionales bacterium]